MNATITLFSEIKTSILRWFVPCIEIDCEVEYDFEIENDSIGSYEFWGQRCYDQQPNYVGDVYVESVSFDPADLPWIMRNRWGVALAQRLLDGVAEMEADGGQIRDAALDYYAHDWGE